jgi:hypothetical protein
MWTKLDNVNKVNDKPKIRDAHVTGTNEWRKQIPPALQEGFSLAPQPLSAGSNFKIPDIFFINNLTL